MDEGNANISDVFACGGRGDARVLGVPIFDAPALGDGVGAGTSILRTRFAFDLGAGAIHLAIKHCDRVPES